MIDKAPAPTLYRFLVDEFFLEHFQGKSPDTRRTYETAVQWFAEFLARRAEVADLTREHLDEFRGWADAKLSKTTARGALQRLRTVWRAAHRAGHLPDQPPAPWWWTSGLPATAGTTAEQKPPTINLRPLKPLSEIIVAPNARPETLAEYLPIYALERGLRPGSVAMLRYALASYERALGHACQWEHLNDLLVNAWLARLLETKAPEGVRSFRNCILAMWRAAYEARIIEHFPTRIRRVKRRARRPECWTIEQIEHLLKTCERLTGYLRRDPKVSKRGFWRALVVVGYYTGLRLGDLMALRWSDITPGGVLTVVQRKTGDLVAAQLPLEVLKQLEELHSPSRSQVFGELYGRSTLTELFARILRAAGLSGSIKWLRRTGASHVEAILPGGARGFLGHRSDISLAYAYYVDPAVAQRLKPTPPRIALE